MKLGIIHPEGDPSRWQRDGACLAQMAAEYKTVQTVFMTPRALYEASRVRFEPIERRPVLPIGCDLIVVFAHANVYAIGDAIDSDSPIKLEHPVLSDTLIRYQVIKPKDGILVLAGCTTGSKEVCTPYLGQWRGPEYFIGFADKHTRSELMQFVSTFLFRIYFKSDAALPAAIAAAKPLNVVIYARHWSKLRDVRRHREVSRKHAEILAEVRLNAAINSFTKPSRVTINTHKGKGPNGSIPNDVHESPQQQLFNEPNRTYKNSEECK